MFEYEIQQYRHADLIREAAAERLVRQLRADRRAERRAAKDRGEGRVNSQDSTRFTRAA
ncbi:hypothetical protein [Streptomyces lunaelactis]|uniref:hypothetical protein n=1 Tax=Streptomyces lunaelactis TaxID=1535768 RepID=UPI001474EF31|nr:hypothetical protein [Streptomyces lunaelactis]NUK82890.1 hypothetical protein [Streptomyces lunaelactis]NUL05866.1 hypothetical protein [Streptomyces lunaelactis]